jgi:hypothetical protein
MADQTVVGPRGGQVHFINHPTSAPVSYAYCGKPEPRHGWTFTTDGQNNANRSGFCARCMNYLVGGFAASRPGRTR